MIGCGPALTWRWASGRLVGSVFEVGSAALAVVPLVYKIDLPVDPTEPHRFPVERITAGGEVVVLEHLEHAPDLVWFEAGLQGVGSHLFSLTHSRREPRLQPSAGETNDGCAIDPRERYGF
jgi:hypothetical protein